MWGLAQPFAGALADRFGATKVVFVGGVLYAVGLVFMGLSDSAWSLSLSAGLLIGIGLSGTSFSVILGVVGRAVAPEKRSMAMGIASAAGSFGQFAMVPGTLGLISWLGWSAALLALGLMVALILPLVGMLKDKPLPVLAGQQTLREALKEACSHSGFWLLAFGFFVCGFQVVFIGVHLPAYLVDQHLPATTGTTVLALIGLFNIIGTYTAGWLGGRMSKPRLLTALYLLRAVVFVPYLGEKLLPDLAKIHAAKHGTDGPDPYGTPFYQRVRRLVEWCVRRRKTVIVLTLLLFIGSVALFRFVPQQFFPASGRLELMVDLKLAEGTSLSNTADQVKRLEALLKEHAGIDNYVAYVGTGSPRFYLPLDQQLPAASFAQYDESDNFGY